MRKQTSSNWLTDHVPWLKGLGRPPRGAAVVVRDGPAPWPGADSLPAAMERARLLAALADYLRQPCYGLNLASDNLLRHPDQPPGAAVLLQMKAALRSLDDRLEAARLVARLEAGGFHAELSEFSMQPMLDRLDAGYGPLAGDKGLRWDVTPSIAKVRSNPVLLERMVDNLVGNAVRFTASGGVVVSCRTRGGHLLLQVWDTGPGIEPRYQARIFEAFFRDAAQATGDGSVGLGLSIVKSGAQVLGIGVGLRSVPGRGSCFSLRVPLVQGSDPLKHTPPLRLPTPG